MDVYCHATNEKRGKLDSKAMKLKFVGYSEVLKAHLLDPRRGKVVMSRDVKVLDTCQPVDEAEIEELVIPSSIP